ncbi:BglG family transcription antiterminator [Terribacillus sp. AE2B 122]|uniref:BglG family transcription antiterminator n=1 Tax=Terribacillus sp. AE2B 122 TaxID=1331902 RepID=UPI0015817985|nr:BglG family transcription antiterminator [Terribacillus sp. AE2B 122]
MKKEVSDLVMYFLEHHSSSITAVEKEVLRNKLSLQACVDDVNQYLKKEDREVILIDTKKGSITINDSTREGLYYILKHGNMINLDYIAPEMRESLLFIKLCITDENPTLQDLADFVQVSKNTALQDLKRIREVLSEKLIELNYTRKNGYSVSGEECKIRKLFIEEIKRVLATQFGFSILCRLEFLNGQEIFFLRQRLINMEKKLSIALTDEQIDDLPVVLYFLIQRMKHSTASWQTEFDLADIEQSDEIQTLKHMFWDSHLDDKDKTYLALQILSSNMLESVLAISSSNELSLAVRTAIDMIDIQLATNLLDKTELMTKILLHLRPAIYRMRFHLPIQNPLTDQFIAEFPAMFAIVSKSVYPIEKCIGASISKEELVYLAMIIQAWIYRAEEKQEYAFQALVVCRNGTSVSKLLLETLKDMFSHIQFIGAYAERNFKEYEQEVDFIFSTVPLNTPKKTFIVKPFLNRAARLEIRNAINKHINHNADKRARELTYYLKEHITEENYQIVHDKIVDFFSETPKLEAEGSTNSDIFSFKKEHILFLDETIQWKDALAYAIKPLLARGSITENYSQKMYEIFGRESDRMMLGPQVYLPHAKPSDGVQKQDFSILICRNLIQMPDTNLAKIIVVLAPSDYHLHVPTLLHLNEIFLEEDKLNKIVSASHKEDVLKIIEEGNRG